ncbi:hypothetical protein, partial [Halomonas casei]|uniref:hypothetical protein n=1 Tax=Halomonas casei TaxID=2742613 RepID=UPI001CE49AE1
GTYTKNPPRLTPRGIFFASFFNFRENVNNIAARIADRLAARNAMMQPLRVIASTRNNPPCLYAKFEVKG